MPSFFLWPLIQYVLMAAGRDRLIHALVILVVVGVSLSLFLGGSALAEAKQFSVVFAAGGLRFAGVAGLVLFIVFYVRRSFEHKDVEYFLSRPITRRAYLLSHAAAFSVLALFIALLITGALYGTAPDLWGAGHILWALSLGMEYMIMANAALFFAFVLTSPAVTTLAVFALYVLARMMGQLLGIVDHGGEGAGAEIMGFVMQIISLIVPRLDLMAQTSWLIYPPDDTVSYGFIVIHGVVYSLLLWAMALFDLERRQF